MSCLGNILWLALGGILLALFWALFGLLWCITIVGIPIGVLCFKFAALSLGPFGKDIEYSTSPFPFIVNIIWLLLGGLEIALCAVGIGVVFCVSIIGIPFGLQAFKFAKLALMPFGARIVQM